MPPQPVTLTPSSIINRHGDPTFAGLREWRDVLEQKYETSIISVWFINRKKAIAGHKCCNVTQSWWRWVCVTKACPGCGEIVPRPEIWIIRVIRTFIRTQLTLQTLETLVLRTSDQYHEMSASLAAAHPLIAHRTLFNCKFRENRQDININTASTASPSSSSSSSHTSSGVSTQLPDLSPTRSVGIKYCDVYFMLSAALLCRASNEGS